MKRRDESGFVFIPVLLVAVLLGAMTTVGLRRASTLQKETLQERGRSEAFHAAEGGLAYARCRLRRDPSWTGDTIRVGRSKVILVAESLPAGKQVRVRSAATCPVRGEYGHPVKSRLEAVLRHEHGRWVVESWSER